MYVRQNDFRFQSSRAGISARMTSLAILSGAALCVAISFVSAGSICSSATNIWPGRSMLKRKHDLLRDFGIRRSGLCREKRRAKARAVAAAQRLRSKSDAGPLLADPMLLTACLQIMRAIGVKKVVPLLAVAGLAAGFLANRGNPNSDDKNDDEV